jgi:hypothetical protein
MNKSAQALGRLAAGHRKNYSAAERKKRSNRMREVNARRLAALPQSHQDAPELPGRVNTTGG